MKETVKVAEKEISDIKTININVRRKIWRNVINRTSYRT